MTPTPEPERVDTYGCSRMGKGRRSNGDQFVVAELRRAARVHHASKTRLDHSRRFGAHQAHVLLVADGVSGQSGARRASSLVVDEVLDSILNSFPWTPELDVEAEASLRQELKDTVLRCDDQVTSAARPAPARSDMASTLTLAFVRWPSVFVVHAGDSRAYLIRDGEIERLTTDHTLAQQMVDDGELEPDQAETTRFATILWNAVGGSRHVKPELTTRELQAGDALLLCSDGLWSYLSDGAILRLVESGESAREICEELVGVVESVGGRDDVTVVLARFEGEIEQGAELEAPERGPAEWIEGPPVQDPSKPSSREGIHDPSKITKHGDLA